MITSVEHKERLRDYFDGLGFERWSAIYGEGELSRVRRTIRTGHNAMLAVATRWLDEAAPTAARALDAGCGTGLWTTTLAQRGFAVTAIDIAPQMVAATERAAAAAGLADRVACATGDLDSVQGSFDLVSCFDVVIHYAPDDALAMCAGLAKRSQKRLLLTYAPWEPLLAALHWIGGRFPHGQRRTDIQMLHEQNVRSVLRTEGMQVTRQQRISSGFYHVTLVEAVRET